jgi:proteic killer suppression protein
MKVRNIVHKAIRRLYEEDQTKGLPAGSAEKLRDMLSFIDRIKTVEELQALKLWKAHTLTGDRKGTWALHVTRNWRLTFRVENDEICDVSFEDYH